jgi:hypothetical protein
MDLDLHDKPPGGEAGNRDNVPAPDAHQGGGDAL